MISHNALSRHQSTSTIELLHVFREIFGLNVLVVDCDMQRNTSQVFLVDDEASELAKLAERTVKQQQEDTRKRNLLHHHHHHRCQKQQRIIYQPGG
jgi:hypothetical protein